MRPARKDRWYVRFRPELLGIGITVGFAGLLFAGQVRWCDLWRAYPSPERHENVREERISSSDLPRADGGDFDGDGTLDVIERNWWYPMRRLFHERTRHLLIVRSCATGHMGNTDVRAHG
jgi:hypothetical protein